MPQPRIIGYGLTPLGRRLNQPAHVLMQRALNSALVSAGLKLDDLDGLVAVPSLSHPQFMEAHALATRIGLLPRRTERPVRVRTIDTGGAGPVSALLQAVSMVKHEKCQAVAIVAGDAVATLDTAEFLRRADGSLSSCSGLPSPAIPMGYGRVADDRIKAGIITREHLAMTAVLMSRQSARHPLALTRRPHTLADVLAAPTVAPHIGLLECARRADGGAALIVASIGFLEGRRLDTEPLNEEGFGAFAATGGVTVLGGGEASGPFPPVSANQISESMFSCEDAARAAFSEAGVGPADSGWWGLYDCFPICFLLAVEACGLVERGGAGRWVEACYDVTSDPTSYAPSSFPINTHGGLLAFGAPWEVPAMYALIEACEQLTARAGARQVRGANHEPPLRALVYGNGGIFSHSSVAILERGRRK